VKWTVMFVALFLMSFPMLAQSQASADGVQGKPLHDREFWRAIAKNRYAVPDGQPVFPLLRELSGYLGSRDPELRDDLAYSKQPSGSSIKSKFRPTNYTRCSMTGRPTCGPGLVKLGMMASSNVRFQPCLW
jgi:hypothetical protein